MVDSSRRLIDRFGCSQSVDISACLGSVSAADIMIAGVYRNESAEDGGGWYWLPVIDGGYAAEPIISEEPLNTLLSGSDIFLRKATLKK